MNGLPHRDRRSAVPPNSCEGIPKIRGSSTASSNYSVGSFPTRGQTHRVLGCYQRSSGQAGPRWVNSVGCSAGGCGLCSPLQGGDAIPMIATASWPGGLARGDLRSSVPPGLQTISGGSIGLAYRKSVVLTCSPRPKTEERT